MDADPATDARNASEGAALLARLDRLPVWPYPWKVLAVIGAGFFFSFFDIVTIGFALPVITDQCGISAERASWAITSGLAGYIPITGENIPTSVRATGVALTDGFGHLGGAFCGQIIFAVEASYGFTGAFVAMALTGLLAALLVGFVTGGTGQSLAALEEEA